MANRHERSRGLRAKQAKELRVEWEAQLTAMEQQRSLSQLHENGETQGDGDDH